MRIDNILNESDNKRYSELFENAAHQIGWIRNNIMEILYTEYGISSFMPSNIRDKDRLMDLDQSKIQTIPAFKEIIQKSINRLFVWIDEMDPEVKKDMGLQ